MFLDARGGSLNSQESEFSPRSAAKRPEGRATRIGASKSSPGRQYVRAGFMPALDDLSRPKGQGNCRIADTTIYSNEIFIMKLDQSFQTLRDILTHGAAEFTRAKIFFGHGTDNAWDEAVYLVLHALNLPQNTNKDALSRILTAKEVDAILSLYQKRIKTRIPAPYLVKEAWFAGLPFYVDERVLIPRSPFAELIQKRFEPWLDEKFKVKRILDIGAGSACMAIAAALAFPEAKVDASDVSDDALAVAKINVEKHGMNKRVTLIKSDVFSNLSDQVYDIIISNPPYVAAEEFLDLPKEYLHEPKLALAAGKLGLDIVRRILKDAVSHLSPQGLLFVEVGNSEVYVEKAFPHLPFTWLEFSEGGGGVFMLAQSELQNWR
ncbi:MAG: 50S ribosomal protein L3 N(5)-glutamine methyltransferase [Gammaproteobacteria bacterium]